ncbi:MAG: tripartite tricarboxylate transporter substrate binding protein [Burkholderiales bacterium]|nr:tripartite tricarboxylate transporter substrate binding protein [Burkholderiales bacterium]
MTANSRRAPRQVFTAASLLVAGLSCWLAAGAAAQSFPVRPVRAIIPFSAGGAVDVPARALSPRLSEIWGQPIVLENRPGAGGTLGAAEVAKAAPDGHLLLFVSNTHLISAGLYRNLPYDAVRDFAAVIEMGAAPNGVVAHPSLGVKSLGELFAAAKARPGVINYASSGNGSTQHLLGAHLFSLAGVNLTHVPYKGSGPATTDLVAGRVQASVPGMSNVIQHIRAGKLLALAVTSPQRHKDLPEVPAVAETFPGYDGSLWMGLLAPVATPRELVGRIHRDVAMALGAEEVRRGFTRAGFDIQVKSPEEFGRKLALEMERWSKVIRESGARID